MSSRVLRKLQADKEIRDDISDQETDIPVSGGARRKQLNINCYDLLNQQSHSESEVKEDDNETEAANTCEGEHIAHDVKRKKKKKKKKSGKHVNNPQRSSEDNADVDEVERSVREVNRLLGENHVPKLITTPVKSEKGVQNKNILSVQHRHLNPNNELKRIFGSKIIQADHKRKNRGRGHVKTTWLVNSKETWPQASKAGLSMALLESKAGVQYFSYEHSASYRHVQNRFLESVESLNPDNIVAIITDHPYHIDALIQLSDLCKHSEDLPMAAEFIERALFCLECAFHPLFSVAQGSGRLSYQRQENRALYITLFKHLTFVGGRACCRTALEFCKLLLSLDPDGDPLAIKLAIDFYAIRAREYEWFIEFTDEWESTKNLLQLPNFAYSYAVAQFYTSNGDLKVADRFLRDALLMFPGVLMPLLEMCSVQIDGKVSGHRFFGEDKKQPAALTQLIQLYVNRCYHIWKDSDLIHWMERNVHALLDDLDKFDAVIKENQAKRAKRYQCKLPRSIARHIILSDIKDLAPMADDFTGPVFGFDPLPPADSINIYTRPKRATVQVNTNTTPLNIFFRSILPNFNPNQIPPNLLEAGREEDGARNMPANENNANEGGNLPMSVATLIGAMRDLLNNVRTELPNDADVDDDYDDLT